jgi:hypothetical protein
MQQIHEQEEEKLLSQTPTNISRARPAASRISQAQVNIFLVWEITLSKI